MALQVQIKNPYKPSEEIEAYLMVHANSVDLSSGAGDIYLAFYKDSMAREEEDSLLLASPLRIVVGDNDTNNSRGVVTNISYQDIKSDDDKTISLTKLYNKLKTKKIFFAKQVVDLSLAIDV